jgi:hypothetical protein
LCPRKGTEKGTDGWEGGSTAGSDEGGSQAWGILRVGHLLPHRIHCRLLCLPPLLLLLLAEIPPLNLQCLLMPSLPSLSCLCPHCPRIAFSLPSLSPLPSLRHHCALAALCLPSQCPLFALPVMSFQSLPSLPFFGPEYPAIALALPHSPFLSPHCPLIAITFALRLSCPLFALTSLYLPCHCPH